ncbi:hypothetical protein Hanom_Chr09g00777961 [Helianthus anomalus]
MNRIDPYTLSNLNTHSLSLSLSYKPPSPVRHLTSSSATTSNLTHPLISLLTTKPYFFFTPTTATKRTQKPIYTNIIFDCSDFLSKIFSQKLCLKYSKRSIGARDEEV